MHFTLQLIRTSSEDLMNGLFTFCHIEHNAMPCEEALRPICIRYMCT